MERSTTDNKQPARYRCLTREDFSKRLMRKRNLNSDLSMNTELNRCLGFAHLTAYALAHTVGAGLYVLTGTLVRKHAGSSASFAYLIAGISACFTAACYSEFATLIPRAGSSYTYTYLMLGELPAFLVGWTMISDLIVGMSAISKALSGTIDLMTDGAIENWSVANLPALGAKDSSVFNPYPDLVAALFIITLMGITVAGVEFSLTFNIAVAALQMGCLLTMLIAAFCLGDSKNIELVGPRGALLGIEEAISIGIFAFSGFECLATAGEEAKNPKRDIPRALFASLGVCIVLYFVTPFALNMLSPIDQIDLSAPFPVAFKYVGNVGLMWFASVATLLATGAAKVVGMHAIPRMFYALSNDGLLFRFMGYVHPCNRVPIWSLLVGGLISILLATFLNIHTLAEFTSIGVIFCYFFVGLNLIVLRYLHRDEITAPGGTSSKTGDSSPDDYTTPILTARESAASSGLMPSRKWAQSIRHKYPRLFLRSNFIYALVLFIVSCGFFAGSMRAPNVWTSPVVHALFYVILAISTVSCVASSVYLGMFKPRKFEGAFESKAMPLCPCVTMLFNTLMIFTLSWMTWVRFLVWTMHGLVIYFAYSMWFSKVEETYGRPEMVKLSELQPENDEIPVHNEKKRSDFED